MRTKQKLRAHGVKNGSARNLNCVRTQFQREAHAVFASCPELKKRATGPSGATPENPFPRPTHHLIKTITICQNLDL